MCLYAKHGHIHTDLKIATHEVYIFMNSLTTMPKVMTQYYLFSFTVFIHHQGNIPHSPNCIT